MVGCAPDHYDDREPATDLGYLLHKHPGRVQTFDESVGAAHVFYPEVGSGGHGGAAARGRSDRARPRPQGRPATGFALGQYVNDRPYAASSMLAMAIKDVFRTALTGRCDCPAGTGRPAIRWRSTCRRCRAAAGSICAAAVRAAGLAGRGDRGAARPDAARLGRLALPGRPAGRHVRLADALNHLYVLLPVLDDAKHYWVSTTRWTSSSAPASGWLAGPPGEGADHPALPGAPARADPGRAGPAGRGRRHGAGGPGQRGRRRAGSSRSPTGRCR